MKMYLISDNVDTYTGMRLVGIEGCVVHEKQELKEAMERAIADKSIGVLLLTEKFGRDFPDVVTPLKMDFLCQRGHWAETVMPRRTSPAGTGQKPERISMKKVKS